MEKLSASAWTGAGIRNFCGSCKKIDRETPKALVLHIIADNRATHKHPAVKARLARRPRFRMRFTPTSASWLNAVEGFFSKLAKKRLRRGVFKSVPEFESAILRFIEEKNEKAKPFAWTADPDKIIEKINRGKQTLESIH
jgi:transposase